MCQDKEGRKCLFNDTLNTFYLRLYGVRHMVKDHSDSERGNLLPPHGLLFPRLFYMHHPTDRIAHTTAFVTPVVEHLLGREIAQWVHPMKDRSDVPSHHEPTLLPRSYISPHLSKQMLSRQMLHYTCYVGFVKLGFTLNSLSRRAFPLASIGLSNLNFSLKDVTV